MLLTVICDLRYSVVVILMCIHAINGQPLDVITMPDVLPLGSGTDCSIRTQIYNQHGSGNSNSYYYDPRTLSDSTQIIANFSEYASTLLRHNISCSGQWCSGGPNWLCVNTGCYTRLYIIPPSVLNVIIPHCTSLHDIWANSVMAHHLWVDQLNDMTGERAVILGYQRIVDAYTAVYLACYKTTPPYIPDVLCEPPRSWLIVVYVLAGICVVLGVPFVICVLAHYIVQGKKVTPNETTYLTEDL